MLQLNKKELTNILGYLDLAKDYLNESSELSLSQSEVVEINKQIKELETLEQKVLTMRNSL